MQRAAAASTPRWRMHACSIAAVRFLPPCARPMASRMPWKARMRWPAIRKVSARKDEAAAGLPALLRAMHETTVIPACSYGELICCSAHIAHPVCVLYVHGPCGVHARGTREWHAHLS